MCPVQDYLADGNSKWYAGVEVGSGTEGRRIG